MIGEQSSIVSARNGFDWTLMVIGSCRHPLMPEIKVKLTKHPENRVQVLQSLSARLDDLPLEVEYTVVVDQVEEGRRQAQNRLAWVWNTECGRFYGENADHMHGMNKCKVLYPLMLEWEKHRQDAIYFRDAVKMLKEPEHAYWLADRTLRTKDLTVKEFAIYLTTLQGYWGQQGLTLTTLVEEYEQAMGQRSAA